MTLKSTIDLDNYPLNDCSISYVLTAKLSQNSLEAYLIYIIFLFQITHFFF